MDKRNPQKGKKGKGAKIAGFVAVIVVLVVLSGLFLLFRYYANLLKSDYGTANDYPSYIEDGEGEELLDVDIDPNFEVTADINGEELIRADHVKNILLIGADSGTTSGRSDAVLLLSFNESTGQMVLTSFLRDMYLDIPEVGENRLNAAFKYGGASLLIQTLQYNFGVAIDHYALVGFSEFENIVDILGGVNVELTSAEIANLELNLVGTNVMHMDGAWALRFVRIRKLDSDFGRTDRQRRLLASIYKEFRSANIFEINTLLNEILPQVTTNMSEGDILDMVLSWSGYSKYDMVANTIPAEGSYGFDTINKMSVLTVDLGANKAALVDNIFNGALTVEANGILG